MVYRYFEENWLQRARQRGAEEGNCGSWRSDDVSNKPLFCVFLCSIFVPFLYSERNVVTSQAGSLLFVITYFVCCLVVILSLYWWIYVFVYIFIMSIVLLVMSGVCSIWLNVETSQSHVHGTVHDLDSISFALLIPYFFQNFIVSGTFSCKLNELCTVLFIARYFLHCHDC